MARAIEEFRALNATGKPFLGAILTVSNHKPYTYPAGRIPEAPYARKREHAVKYADYALGQFFKAARKEAFGTNTVFAVVADHGARGYGSQRVPIASYEIPLIIAGPAVVANAARVDALGSSLDVSPTLLGLMGRPYDSLFFGRDLLKQPPGKGRVPMNRNRDIGLCMDKRMVTLSLRKTVEYLHRRSPSNTEAAPNNQPGAADFELEKDCAALYQVADELQRAASFGWIPRRFRARDCGRKVVRIKSMPPYEPWP